MPRGRFAWSQLRFRSGRALALLVGMLVAATAFTVLTAAARTAQVRTVGTVKAHFRPPTTSSSARGARAAAWSRPPAPSEPDFLSGIYGGITLAQWRQIQRIPGVQVAVPIAMVGDGLVNADFPAGCPLPRDLAPAASLPGHHDLGERERRHPDRPAPDLRLRHPGPGAPTSS